MKQLLTTLILLISFNSNGQIFKKVYDDFMKYGTFYVAGDINNSYQTQRPSYFVRTDPNDLYAVPQVIDETVVFPHDYRIGFGFRKLARFDYEIKPGNFWTGNNKIEKQTALSAPTSAVKGFEYLFHFEKERQRGEEFTNLRYFLRHTGKYHIVKFESREEGNVGFKYNSAEIRARLPIGKKFSLSAGAMYRTHEKAYGYNPIEIWLNEIDDNGNAANPWYSLGYEYGYSDHYTTYVDYQTGEQTADWIWKDENDNIVAYSDRDFRDRVFGDLMNRYNNEQWDLLDPFGEIAPVVGVDFYHYKNNFWLHAYGNYILPYHKYLKGDADFNYLNRNNWGKGGLIQDSQPEQWQDHQLGSMFGWKIGKSIGLFVEGEYTDFWDSQIFRTSAGINLTFR